MNYTATISWGDGTTSTGDSVTLALASDGRTFNVLGSHTYTAAGSYPVTVTVQHGSTPPAPTTVTGTAAVWNPAVIPTFLPFSGVAGTALNNQLVASFTDPSGVDLPGNYTAKILWGDGTTTTGTVSLGSDGQTLLVTGGITYAAAGTPTVTVTVVHGTSPVASIGGTAVITYRPVNMTFAPFAGTLGQPLANQAVATFTDPNGAGDISSYTATINWGDGTSTTAGTISLSGGTFTVAGSHTYANIGNYNVQVSVVRGTAPVASTPMTVSGIATITSGHVTPTGGYTVNLAGALVSSPVVATFTDANGNLAISSYSATINWGDGISSTGTITGPINGVYSVTGTHTYFDLGNLPVTVSISRAGAAPVTVTSTASVGTSIVALNPTLSGAVTLSGAATISIGGALVIDSSSTSALTASGSPHISASSIRVVGGESLSGVPSFTPTPIIHTASLADPLAGLPVPGNPGGTLINASIGGSSNVTLNPGLYSQISISGAATVTLNPGIYVIAGGSLSVSGSARLTGNGVMIYVAGSSFPASGGTYGGVTFSGAATITLTPATSGTYAGITLFQARDNNRAIAFSGSARTGINGFLYAPSALLTLSGAVTDLNTGLIVDRLNTSGSASSGLVNNVSGGEDGLPAGELLSTRLTVYVNDPLGKINVAERSRIHDAIASVDSLIVPYGVDITEVSSSTEANLIIDIASTTSLGGAADGVLAVYNPDRSEITLVSGWNWYDGTDPDAAGAGQYDFQTVVTHELGHALGLGHNPNSTSVMYSTLLAGVSRRTLTTTDLNIGNIENLPGALHADMSHRIVVTNDTQNHTGPSSTISPLSFGETVIAAVDFNRADMIRTLSTEWDQRQSMAIPAFPVEISRMESRYGNDSVLSATQTTIATTRPFDGDSLDTMAANIHPNPVSVSSVPMLSATIETLPSDTFGIPLDHASNAVAPHLEHLESQSSSRSSEEDTSGDWEEVVLLGVMTGAAFAIGDFRTPTQAKPQLRRPDRKA